VKWDVLPVTDGERLHLIFESAKPGGRHGIWLHADGGVLVNALSAPSMDIWQDAAPPVVDVVVRTRSGVLHVYNIWDLGEGRGSQSWTSGMRIEDTPRVRRYRCNDIGFNDSFDDLVFRIERPQH
jgi:hypothetical protein